MSRKTHSSDDEWVNIANNLHGIQQTNLSYTTVQRDGACTKRSWNDVCRYFHAVFVMYNHSGQQDLINENGASKSARTVGKGIHKLGKHFQYDCEFPYCDDLLPICDTRS